MRLKKGVKKREKEKITKDMTFSQVLKKYPETSEVFFKNNLSCVGCPMALQETLEQGCQVHGINMKKLLRKLNKKISKKKIK